MEATERKFTPRQDQFYLLSAGPVLWVDLETFLKLVAIT